MRKRYAATLLIFMFIGLIGLNSLFQQINQGENSGNDEIPILHTLPSRESKIPSNKVKMTSEGDDNPPKSFSNEYDDPVPVTGLVNTAGGEDSAFIMPDGNTLYFFFTPDVSQPVEVQVEDQVTGIYVSNKHNGIWDEPARVILQEPGKLALDGCAFVHGDIMYFCTAREGDTGVHWFKAVNFNNTWKNWVNADQELKTHEYSTGELHISIDERELYFHSERPGGLGLLDIWVSEKIDGEWGEPVNIESINSGSNEGWPCISVDGNELWFSRDFAVWRAKKEKWGWGEPEKMFGPLAGEPSVDNMGNVYFTHHFFEDDVMIEADIYIAYKKNTP